MGFATAEVEGIVLRWWPHTWVRTSFMNSQCSCCKHTFAGCDGLEKRLKTPVFVFVFVFLINSGSQNPVGVEGGSVKVGCDCQVDQPTSVSNTNAPMMQQLLLKFSFVFLFFPAHLLL